VVEEGDPGGMPQAAHQKGEVGLLVGVPHRGQGPVQRLTHVQGPRPVQSPLHHPVGGATQLHGPGQGGGEEGRGLGEGRV